MASDDVRLDIGFTGGGSAQIVADAAQWDQLQTALTAGTDEWMTVTLRDNEQFLIRTGQVVYARVASMSRSIGFRDA